MTCCEFLSGSRYFNKAEIRWENEIVIQNTLQRRDGVYVLAMHMGNWELLAAKISQKLYPVHLIVKPITNLKISKYINGLRESFGSYTLMPSTTNNVIFDILKALQKGEIIGFIGDQRRNRGPRVPLFSQSARTNESLSKIWHKKPAPIIPAYIVREGYFKHKAIFLDEVCFSHLSIDNNSHFNNLLKMNQVIEYVIQQAPEQYFWMHNRWK